MMSDCAATSSAAASAWQPVEILSDEDDDHVPPPPPPHETMRPFRSGSSSKREVGGARLRTYLSNAIRSVCYCNRKRKGLDRHNCFEAYEDSLDELLKMRTELDRLHKQDLDDKASQHKMKSVSISDKPIPLMFWIETPTSLD